MIYRALVLIFLVVAVVAVAYKEYGEADKTNPNYIYGKLAESIQSTMKIKKEKIFLTSEFKKHLNMQESEIDTVGFQMQKELNTTFFIDEFRKMKTVGEAVDYLRIKTEESEAKRLKETAKKVELSKKSEKKNK